MTITKITAIAAAEPPEDNSGFSELVNQSLHAFRLDFTYVEKMIRRARAIIHKREVGAIRSEKRQAEKDLQ